MKKIICVIVTLISMFSFFMLFNEAEINSIDNLIMAATLMLVAAIIVSNKKDRESTRF